MARIAALIEGGAVLLHQWGLREGLVQQLRDNATDPVKINALADELEAQQQRIAAAVTANTPTP